MAERITTNNEEFGKRMVLSIDREQHAPQITAYEASDILMAMSNGGQQRHSSPQAPSYSEMTVDQIDVSDTLTEMRKATSLTRQPRNLQMTLEEFEESLKTGMNFAGHQVLPTVERDELVSLPARADLAEEPTTPGPFDKEPDVSYERAQPLNGRYIPPGGFRRLVTEQDTQVLEPIRSIRREKAHAQERDIELRPTWATREGAPDSDTQEAQRKLLTLSIRMRNAWNDEPIDAGLHSVDALLIPVGPNRSTLPEEGGVEHEVLEEAPSDLAKIFDEPDRPIGVFDRAEVDHMVERDRQVQLKYWRRKGYDKDEIEGFHKQFYGMSSIDLDNRANAARENLIASRKRIPPAPPKQRSGASKKRKQDADAVDSGVEEPTEGVRRSKRTRRAPNEIAGDLDEPLQEAGAENEEETNHRLHQELDEMVDQEPEPHPAAVSRKNSQGSSVTSHKSVTFKFGGKVIRTAVVDSKQPSHTGETTEEEDEDGTDLE